MDPLLAAICYTIAAVFFLLVGLIPEKIPWYINIALGLFFALAPTLWNAWEAA